MKILLWYNNITFYSITFTGEVKKMKLSKKMILSFLSLIIVSIIIISSISNFMINRSFKSYLSEEREDSFEKVYNEVNDLYINNGFKLDSMELKHLALANDINITVKDLDGNVEYTSSENNMRRNHMQGPMHGGMGMHNDRSQTGGRLKEKSYTLYENKEAKGQLVISYIDNAYLTDSANVFKNALFKSFIVSGTITIIIGLVISFILSKRLTNPLISIKNTANSIEQGNLQASSNPDTDIQEILELSQSINYLASSLSRQEDIRNRYASDISHELRTPLTTLQTHLEAIIDGVWEPTDEHLEILMSETKVLKELIDNLKDSFNQEEYSLTLSKTSFNLSDLVEETVLAFLPIYNSKGYGLEYNIEDGIIVSMDRNKLKRVINNLLSNSIRYLEKDGKVHVEFKKLNTHLSLLIEDNGIGIKKENLPFVFDRFFRIDSSRNKATGGKGLGLSIVKSIITAHGGKIKVDSVKGKFTKFIITLPIEND